MAKREPPPAPAPASVEPGFVARYLGAEFGTIAFVGGLIAVYSAWAIWDKLWLPGATIPTDLYAYLALGLALLGAGAVVRYLWLREEVEVELQRRRWRKEAKLLLREARRGLKRGVRLKPEVVAEVEAARGALQEAEAKPDFAALPEALVALDRALDRHLSFARKSTAREYTESIAVAVLIALLLRAFVVEAFKIPSGSMIPTLQVGDHIFVNKFIYGIRLPWPFDETSFGRAHQKFFMDIRKPKRGEIIVFKYPRDPDKDFIKRVIAVEGDQVEMRDGVMYVNGVALAQEAVPGECRYVDYEESRGLWDQRRCQAFRETVDGKSYTTIIDRGSTPQSWPVGAVPFPGWLDPGSSTAAVPKGHVFVMGDNRDNSHDSRYWGTVPLENIKGKAIVIWWSSGEPEGIRVKRMGHLVE